MNTHTPATSPTVPHLANRAAFDRYRSAATERYQHMMSAVERPVVSIVMSECTRAKGVENVIAAFREQSGARGMALEIREVGCFGNCYAEPVVEVRKAGWPAVMYGYVTADDVPLILDGIRDDRANICRPLGVYFDGPADEQRPEPFQGIPAIKDDPFWNKQQRIVLGKAGLIDPLRLDEYVARGGYASYAKALFDMTEDEVIAEMKTSNVRGRGGAGFQAGIKWESARASVGYPKYVCCNAHEGEPNVFKDRKMLELDPHETIEGILIACYAIGSDRGYIYIGGEYPLAIRHFRHAVREAEAAGLIGENVLGSGFSVEMVVRVGGGAYICGEGSAMLYSLQGTRGQPRTKPPRSVEYGLWGRPTVVNNVETLANAPHIIEKGGAWYASIGVDKSQGTKVYTMGGNIKGVGMSELPFGVTTGELINEVHLGMRDGFAFKGLQTGGVSGGVLTEEDFDLPMTFEGIEPAGGLIGSAGFVVYDHTTSMVDMAHYMIEFNRNESCGKCTPCRLGTQALLEVLDRFQRGQGRVADLDVIMETSDQIIKLSLCGLGQAAPVPVQSMILKFRHEFEERCIDAPKREPLPLAAD
ncbi:MAG: NADH-ubiquinone oxidoreductase-F iron-sulfur binding region domain-containing protein [Thermomicrobiales bacterium]